MFSSFSVMKITIGQFFFPRDTSCVALNATFLWHFLLFHSKSHITQLASSHFASDFGKPRRKSQALIDFISRQTALDTDLHGGVVMKQQWILSSH